VKDKEGRSDEAESGCSVVPSQLRAEVERCEDTEDYEGNDFLDDFKLDRGKAAITESICGHLEAVLEKGNGPTYEDDFPKRLRFKFQMTVPGNGHEDVGEDEKNHCPHTGFGRGLGTASCRAGLERHMRRDE